MVAQLAGSDPGCMVQAARMLIPFVDGIDVNYGCPQQCALLGGYGAHFATAFPDRAVEVVKVRGYLSLSHLCRGACLRHCQAASNALRVTTQTEGFDRCIDFRMCGCVVWHRLWRRLAWESPSLSKCGFSSLPHQKIVIIVRPSRSREGGFST